MSVDNVAVYAFLQAVLFRAYASVHGLIALVLEHFHVVAPHGIGVLHATVTLAHRN
jgi:hypothetical protein